MVIACNSCKYTSAFSVLSTDIHTAFFKSTTRFTSVVTPCYLITAWLLVNQVDSWFSIKTKAREDIANAVLIYSISVLQISIHNSQNSKLSTARIFFLSLFVSFLTQWSPNPWCVLHYRPKNYRTFLVVKTRRWSFISKGSEEEMTQRNTLWSSAPEFAGSINDLLQASLSSCTQCRTSIQEKESIDLG